MKVLGDRRSQPLVSEPARPAPVLVTERERIDWALKEALCDVVRAKLGTGEPVIMHRDGETVHVPAEELAAELGLE